MKALQYTIRNVPNNLDVYLRKKVRLSGKSLNQVIIDELSEVASIKNPQINNGLDWFIGSGIDKDSLKALEEDDILQKTLAQKEL